MIKFAFSKPLRKPLYILLFIILTGEIFGKPATEYFQKPLQKCWEINNPLIDGFASDNESLIISQTDGNIIRLDKFTSDQIWKTSIGNKGSSIIRLIKDKILIVTLEEASNSENRLAVRNLDGLSGVVKDLKEFPGVSKEIDSTDLEKGRIFYLNSKSGIGKLDLENESLDWFSTNYKVNENTTLSADKLYFAFVNDSEITRVKISNESDRQTVKSNSSQIVAVSLANDSLFWGDDSGKVFQKESNKKTFEKVLRTGGKISSLQHIDNNILITSNDNYLYLYSPKNKRLLWKKRLSGRVTFKPQAQENIVVVTTNAESDLYFVNLENGKTFNQISLPIEAFIRKFQVDGTSLYVQTNLGLIRFSEDCSK